MEEMLDAARREKDMLEGQVALLQEQLSRSQAMATRTQDQLQHLQEECKVCTSCYTCWSCADNWFSLSCCCA